ncbi:MAG: hypothetical protein JNK82_25195 [Myxococcaceae bacterium]|nr:hypothetical protein [Myxococcaceae bacterium]
MTSLAFVMTVLSADPACFVPRDATPGWKQVTLPANAPALAAPEGVPQFRSGQDVEVVDVHPGLWLSGSHYSPGLTRFTLKPGDGACSLSVVFKERLRGAKVDVEAWGPGGNMTLVHEERVAGTKLEVGWGNPGVREVYVTVHDHLRDAPVLQEWSSRCVVNASSLPVSDAYRLRGSLYYLQPAQNVVVPLCNKPEVHMRVYAGQLPGNELPTAVSVKLD